MRILISTVGSHGDVLPFISLANEFIKNGDEVIFYANPFFKTMIFNKEIKFVEIGTIDEYNKIFKNVENKNPTKSFILIASELMRLCPIYYEAMKNNILENHTISITNSLLFSARLLEETHNIPCVTIHLSPSIFRSNQNPARLTPSWIKKETPEFIKNISWCLLDKLFYEPNFNKPLNIIRKKYGLKEVKRIFKSWIHESNLVIGLFPSWFAKPQSDWVSNINLIDFPLDDNSKYISLSQEILDFIKSKDTPIVVFSAGTATANDSEFFKTSIKACKNLDIRAILLTHFKEQIPANLPKNIIHIEYAPFSLLLPKVDLFVHHGGIGSTSQALKAGVPQLIRPVAYDQFDNSSLAVNLGVAKEILIKNYNIKNIVNSINEILSVDIYKNNAKLVAKNFTKENTMQKVCELILEKYKKEYIK